MSNIKIVKTKSILIVTTFCSYDPINFRKLSMDQPMQLTTHAQIVNLMALHLSIGKTFHLPTMSGFLSLYK